MSIPAKRARRSNCSSASGHRARDIGIGEDARGLERIGGDRMLAENEGIVVVARYRADGVRGVAIEVMLDRRVASP